MPRVRAVVLLVGILSAVCLSQRAQGAKLVGAWARRCPTKCRCVTVARALPSGSRLLQRYTEMYGWLEGAGAAVCWGRKKIPTSLLKDVSYLLVRGGRMDGPGNLLKARLPNPEVSEDGQRIGHIPEGTFERAHGVHHLDLRGNKLRKLGARIFEGLGNLQTLSLRDNKVPELTGGVFGSLGNLTRLCLSGNRLRSLPDEGFVGSSRLTELDLSHNPLRRLPNTSLAGLSDLRLLNLSRGRLEEIPDNLLTDLTALQELYLDGNRIKTLPVGIFDGNDRLEILSLKDNRIRHLPEFLLRRQVRLVSLDLSGNSLVKLGVDTLPMPSALLRVDLSSNRLTELSRETFRNCTSLVLLDASSNNLREISEETLGEMASLRELSLAGNNISRIVPGSLQGLGRLETLDLTENSLRLLEARSFRGLRDLLSLRLDDNVIEKVEPDAFSVGHYSMSSKLTWLNLKGNNLKELVPDMFRGAPFVKMLNLADNKIASILPSSFYGLRGLASLSLRGNRMGSIKEGAFDGAVGLGSLDLSDNSIHRVDEGALQGVRSLVELTLANNELDETTSDWLAGLTSLAQLDLSGNRFARGPRGLLTSLRNLRHASLARNIMDTFRVPDDSDRPGWLSRLDLSHNNLRTIEGGLHSVMATGGALDLSGNPWLCDCALTSDVRELTSRGAHLENANITYCGTRDGDSTNRRLTSVTQTADAICNARTSQERLDLQKSEFRAVSEGRCQIIAAVSKANNSWPWYAVVWNARTDSVLCNAALIGRDWAVTSLRCLQPIRANLSTSMPDIFKDVVRREQDSLLMAPSGLVLRLGKREQLLHFEAEEHAYSVMNIHIPANERGLGLDRPVLLQLASLAARTRAIAPICLPEAPVKGQRALVLGWGMRRTRTAPPRNALQSSRLRLAATCGDLADDVIGDVILCGARERGQAVDYAVLENVGGALVTKRGRGDWMLLGIATSMDTEGRSLFINLFPYKGWIKYKTDRSRNRNEI